VVAYTPNVSFWSDHAVKSRWFSIRNLEDNIGFNASGSFELPTGMVWVKHFDLDTTRGDSGTRRKLETRILVKTTDGTYGLSYRWREDQSDADLVSEEGKSELVPASSPAQEWRYPSRSECFACHTDTAGHALSFNARQLNRIHSYGDTDANQLDALASAGYFSDAIGNVQEIPALAAIDDESVSLEWRVRSYLDTNCAQCHQPGGNAPGFWDARASTPTDLAKIINGELVNDGGDIANRFSVPSDAAHSMVLLRLAGEKGARMPPLTTSERDVEAENLIRRWIEETLPDRQEFALWEVEHFQPGEFANLSLTGDTLSITFEHPAHRSAVVETSTDLKSWTLWDVPGNLPFFPANSFTRSFEGLTLPESRSFRIRVTAP
jgi:mono/diheme cytochrome c family protein